MPSAENLIKKKSGEKLAVAMDFGKWLDSSNVLSTIVSITTDFCATSSDVTITSSAISGTRVVFFVEAGQAGIRYTITVTVTTSVGETLIGDGILVVE